MWFTSYEVNTPPAVCIDPVGANTAKSMEDTRKDTKIFADRKNYPIPENTRANPADRVKRYRQGIYWTAGEERVGVLSSEKFKKSASLLIHCVLSSLYGETVTLKPYDVNDLLKEKKLPGREHFIREIVKALYGDDKEDKPKMQMDRDKIICICRSTEIIGLLSSTGPIPDTKNGDALSFLELPAINPEEVGLGTMIASLSEPNKKLLKFWLTDNEFVGKTYLYKEIYDRLKDVEDSPDVIKKTFAFDDTIPGIRNFPRLKEYNDEKLLDSITLTPISDEKAVFGYDMSAWGEKDMPALMTKIDELCYTFIPPLTEKAVKWTKDENFVIKSISKREVVDEEKLVSVTICCNIAVDIFTIKINKKYENERIRYIKSLPSFSIYGPAPKFGWIALREIVPEQLKPCPLVNEVEIILNGLEDIKCDIEFTRIEKNYSLYCGEIPEWLGISGNGIFLGGLPLRVDPKAEHQDWDNKKSPAFIHTKPMPRKDMQVAVDIGSSRSVVLFWADGMNENEINSTLIEKDQILSIYLSAVKDDKADVEFENLFFQPEKQDKAVSGKTQMGVLTTPIFERKNDKNLLLYRSGKLITLDPKTISDASGRTIISDIKSKLMESKNEMHLLIQGLLVMIMDRSLHMGCSNIKIRVAYLTEQYGTMNEIWTKAINGIKEEMPGLFDPESKINISIDDPELVLPESLAIANRFCRVSDFTAGSGLALVDIGDLSTDIALFENTDAASQDVDKGFIDIEFKDNISVRFAGNRIILQSIWDYIYYNKAEFKDVFEIAKKNTDIGKIVANLEEELKNRTEKKSVILNEEVRHNLLCLIDRLKEKLPADLVNLFDIGYLTEVIILKRLIEQLPVGSGKFNIHLYGGGSSLFKGNGDDFNWDKVLNGRECETTNKSSESDVLAYGLFKDDRGIAVHEKIKKASESELALAKAGGKSQQSLKIPGPKELKQGYIQFLKDAKKIKNWTFIDKNGRTKPDNFYQAFNIKKENDSSDEPIINLDLWTKNLDRALEFAIACKTNDKEIFKALFAYHMAYSSVVAYYNANCKTSSSEKTLEKR
jgi:hypothetical protein